MTCYKCKKTKQTTVGYWGKQVCQACLKIEEKEIRDKLKKKGK